MISECANSLRTTHHYVQWYGYCPQLLSNACYGKGCFTWNWKLFNFRLNYVPCGDAFGCSLVKETSRACSEATSCRQGKNGICRMRGGAKLVNRPLNLELQICQGHLKPMTSHKLPKWLHYPVRDQFVMLDWLVMNSIRKHVNVLPKKVENVVRIS